MIFFANSTAAITLKAEIFTEIIWKDKKRLNSASIVPLKITPSGSIAEFEAFSLEVCIFKLTIIKSKAGVYKYYLNDCFTL